MSPQFQRVATALIDQARPSAMRESDKADRGVDRGCEMAPSCLDCPFPACIKEEVGGGKRWLKAMRDASIAELRKGNGMSIAELGRRFNVSRRTVYRALEKDKR